MTMEDIEIFLITVGTRNISKTATMLYMSQSTVSHRLIMLEQELGVPLFNRSKGKRLMELTPQGADFVPIGEQWMELWRDTELISSRGNVWTLNVGAVASLNVHLLMPAYQSVVASLEPRINLSVKSGTSYALYSSMEKHEYDVAFVVQTTYHNTIGSRAILSEPLVLIRRCATAAPGMPMFGAELDPLDLDTEKEVLLNYQSRYIQWRNRIWGKTTSARIGTNDADIALPFLLSVPDSWCVVAMSIAMSFSSTMALEIHPLKRNPPERICYVLQNNSKQQVKNEALEFFFAHVNKRMEELEAQKLLTILSRL